MNAHATDFPFGPAETDENGETETTGNSGFLRTVFQDAAEGTRPVVDSFVGNPTTAPKSAWLGHPWLCLLQHYGSAFVRGCLCATWFHHRLKRTYGRTVCTARARRALIAQWKRGG